MNSRLVGHFRTVALALSLGLVSFTSAALAQDLRYRDGRFLETVGGVTLQRADEASSDEAVLNMPFLPGDRVWTDESGRAEIVFADGEVLWIAERSKVDSLGRGGRDQDERLGLRVFAGSFGARVRSGGPGFEFRAPGGSITSTGAGAFRVDVRAGETIVSVSEGELLVDLAGERISLRAGQRVRYADRAVDGPFRYERTSPDRFDRWCEERSTELNRMARNDERLPDDLDVYGDELQQNGDWVYDEPSGYVYVPRVARNWAPYTYGRWVYTLYGWTWVADEPWGFVTSHYGRWGYSSRVGWHWMPRSGFSGAWVGWSSPIGSWNNTIGWCALGFNDRPVGSFSYGTGGRAVARNDSRGSNPGQGWSFANRSDMGRADLHRRRVEVPVDQAQRAVVWNADTTPDREFRENRRGPEDRGVSRGDDRSGGRSDGRARIYVRPSPGDSTPELRSDPTTTIPTPESRRQRTIGQDGFKDEQDNRRTRTRPDGTDFSVDSSEGQATGASPTRPEDRRIQDPRAEPANDSARKESARERSKPDPLLSRFFRSITQSSSSERESNPPRDDSSARRRDPRDDSSTRQTSPRERSSSPEARTSGENGERSRPTAERSQPERAQPERSQPRTSAPPRTPSEGGSSEEQAARRRPKPDGLL